MIIMGIDPGTAITGFGVIEILKNGYKCIDYGCIETDKKLSLEERLVEIGKDLNELIKKHKPDLAGVEELFFYNNITTAISVSHARGIILEKFTSHHIPIKHFTPLQVKQGLTGYGRASKQQIQTMVQTLLSLKDMPKPDDAADALAVALTCSFTKDNIG